MTSSDRPLRFYFDFISPFAYLGWTQIHALAERHRRAVEPVPILFAALLNRWGHKGPAEIEPKRAYTFKYAARIAHDLGVPMRPPPAHPFNPLLVLRLATVPQAPDALRTLIDRIFSAVWADQVDATNPDAIAAVVDAAGLRGTDLLARANARENKDRLKTQTAAALAAGVFGVPTVDVQGELFWGQDSFPHLERYLRGEDPIDPAQLAEWAAMPVGVHRS